MSQLSLAKLHRPGTFEQVIGQEHPVRVISNLIVRGRKRRDLLLHGAVGSGKTSLVRLYGLALNCDAPTGTGSPCGQCSWCRGDNSEHVDYVEYDVPGRGGALSDVESFLKQHLRFALPPGKVKTIFFDEAHALDKEAADSLLKTIEDRDESIVFCFATTEFERIRPALRSRLLPLEVRPLAVDVAIEWLRAIADEHRIAIDDDALTLLAGIRDGYPRDLINGLELVRDNDIAVITANHVKEVFGLDHTEMLVRYFMAVAEGDYAEQLKVVSVAWRRPTGEKIRWIQAFLTSTYYNEILGIRLRVDAAVESIGAEKRMPVITRMCERFGVTYPSQLDKHWARMMAFWSTPLAVEHESALQLKLGLFNHLVARELPGALDGPVEAGMRATLPDPSPIVIETSRGFGESWPPPKEAVRLVSGSPSVDDPRYITAADVRRVVNCSSFLIQQHGVMFNVAFELRPVAMGCFGEPAGRELVDTFCSDFSEQADRWSSKGPLPFTWIRVLEGDGTRASYGVRGYVVGYASGLSDLVDQLGVGDVDPVTRWANAWQMRLAPQKPNGVRVHVARTRSRQARFHWDRTLNLCAGMDERLHDWDPESGSWKPLYELMELGRKLRPVGPLAGPVIQTSSLLAEAAISDACRNRMEPLSAFDARQWKDLRKNWEAAEYTERKLTAESRQRKLRQIEVSHGLNSDRGRQLLAELLEAWPTQPERRSRSAPGWWRKAFR